MSTDTKKIFFIHPLGINWVPGRKDMSRIANIMPPVGLCSLAAWLEQHGHRTWIHDCYAEPLPGEQIVDLVREYEPEYVGISATTSSFPDGVRIAQTIKKNFPDVTIILGGVHISALRERSMKVYPEIDFGVVGEGEEALLSLIESDHTNLDDIPGLLYRDGEDIVFTGYRTSRIDMDALPFPAYEKLEGYPEKYKLPIFNYPRVPNTTAITSRGCPYGCAYCDRSVFGPVFNCNSAEYMFNLVQYLRKKFGIRHINFYDDVFTLDRERIVEFCTRLINADMDFTFNCASRAEQLDTELLRLMKRAGCWMISLGIETGDPELLESVRKNADLERISDTVHAIKYAGIRVKGLFMLGLPGETEQSIDRSIEYCLSLPLDDFNLAKFTPFPGTPLYKNIRDYGEFNEDWELMNCLNFVFVPRAFTRERLEARYREFYRRFFKRSRVLLGYGAMLWKSPDSWVRFIKNLKDFLRIRKEYAE